MATLGGFLCALQVATGNLFENTTFAVIGISWSLAIWYSQWFGHGYIAYLLEKKLPWSKVPLKRLIVDFLAHSVYAFAAINVVNLVMEWLVAEFVTGRTVSVTSQEVLANGGIAMAISLVISGIMTSIGFYMHLRESLLREERLKSELATARYESLKAQMNPHFLFNSLNVLSELVVEDADQAVDFIQKLSHSYRYVLDAGGRQVVPLEEELNFVKDYAQLLQTRFENGLEVDFEVHVLPQEHVPPLALQLLLENAVKHNVVRESDPLQVDYRREGETVVVRNNVRPKRGVAVGGVGLENLNKRLELLGAKGIVVEETATHFSVTVPIVKVETSKGQ